MRADYRLRHFGSSVGDPPACFVGWILVGRIVEGARVDRAIWTRYINIFLLGVPLVLFAGRIGLSNGLALAVVAALALIPLSGFIESAIEELAELLGPFVGGLLHTTFGNLGELFLALAIVLQTPSNIRQIAIPALIAGVVMRNTVLFPGIGIFLGCLRNGRMRFDAERASEYGTTLALTMILILMPSIGAAFGDIQGVDLRAVETLFPYTLTIAGFFLFIYFAYVISTVFRFRVGRSARYHLPAVLSEVSADVSALFAEEREQAEIYDTTALFAEEPQSALTAMSVSLPLPESKWQLLGLLLPPEHHRMLVSEAELSQRADKARMLAEQTTVERPTRSATGPSAGASALAPMASSSTAAAAAVLDRRRAREERGDVGFLAESPVLRGLLAILILALALTGMEAMAVHFVTALASLLLQAPSPRTAAFIVSFVILPLIAGYVDFYGVVGSAMSNRLEIALAVNAGATFQFMCLVVPTILLVGLATNSPVAFIFSPFAVVAVGLGVLAFTVLARVGEATWFSGLQVIGIWTVLMGAAIFSAH